MADLRARIRRDGPLPFEEFMAAALYDPVSGYYGASRDPEGYAADFRTSPQMHAAFAALLARQLTEMDTALGRPQSFRVVELGPGDGVLADGILRSLREVAPGLCGRLVYHLVEASPALRRRQEERLAGLAASQSGSIRWSASAALEEDPQDGVVVANEFFDALPVRRAVQRAEGLREIGVDWDDRSGFVEQEGDREPPELRDYLERYGVPLQEGQRVEIGLQALGWMDRIARILRRGYVIALDYGHPAAALYHPDRRQGTLLAYRGHRVEHRVTERVGWQDLTAHVNFTALERRGAEHGFQAAPLRTQTEFLLGLGVLDHLRHINDDPELSGTERLRQGEAVKQLFLPGGMGETFRVLIQARGVALEGLSGLASPWRQPPLDPSRSGS